MMLMHGWIRHYRFQYSKQKNSYITACFPVSIWREIGRIPNPCRMYCKRPWRCDVCIDMPRHILSIANLLAAVTGLLQAHEEKGLHLFEGDSYADETKYSVNVCSMELVPVKVK